MDMCSRAYRRRGSGTGEKLGDGDKMGMGGAVWGLQQGGEV